MHLLTLCLTLAVLTAAVNAGGGFSKCPAAKNIKKQMQKAHNKWAQKINNVNMNMPMNKLKAKALLMVTQYYAGNVKIVANGEPVVNGYIGAANFWLKRKLDASGDDISFTVLEAWSITDDFAYANVNAQFVGSSLSRISRSTLLYKKEVGKWRAYHQNTNYI